MSRLATVFALLFFALPARAEQALVAVAANFLAPAEVLARAYEAESGHEIALASGATGQIYAQILHGAPYDAFLAADVERPELLETQGLAENRFAYALGRLAILSIYPDFPASAGIQSLINTRFVAIANPDLAPYGRASREVLLAAGLWDDLPKAQGQNIGQTFGMVISGNADAGLVALSMARQADGVFWTVPAELHAPIQQEAVLLIRGKGNLAAEGFLEYLSTEAAMSVIEEFGYDRP